MSLLAPYKELAALIPAQFDKAKASGALNSYASTTELVTEDGQDFELRICPALEAKRAAKPASGTTTDENGKDVPEPKRQKAADPFEGPYDGNDLYVSKVGQEEGGEKMVALLNRFSVVDHHFLLVSEEFQSQSAPLHPPHLLHAFLMLHALKAAGKQYVAIYNCGDKSGASQKRRHLQFVPVDGEAPLDQWAGEAQVDRDDMPFMLPKMPFANANARLPPQLSTRSALSGDPSFIAMTLLSVNIALLDSIHSAIWSQPEDSPTQGIKGEPLSYNVVMTTSNLVLVPRYREKSNLVSAEVGGLSLNSLAFAGLILCAGEAEKDAVKAVGVKKVLGSVGFEKIVGRSTEEGSFDDGEGALAT